MVANALAGGTVTVEHRVIKRRRVVDVLATAQRCAETLRVEDAEDNDAADLAPGGRVPVHSFIPSLLNSATTGGGGGGGGVTVFHVVLEDEVADAGMPGAEAVVDDLVLLQNLVLHWCKAYQCPPSLRRDAESVAARDYRAVKGLCENRVMETVSWGDAGRAVNVHWFPGERRADLVRLCRAALEAVRSAAPSGAAAAANGDGDGGEAPDGGASESGSTRTTACSSTMPAPAEAAARGRSVPSLFSRTLVDVAGGRADRGTQVPWRGVRIDLPRSVTAKERSPPVPLSMPVDLRDAQAKDTYDWAAELEAVRAMPKVKVESPPAASTVPAPAEEEQNRSGASSCVHRFGSLGDLCRACSRRVVVQTVRQGWERGRVITGVAAAVTEEEARDAVTEEEARDAVTEGEGGAAAPVPEPATLPPPTGAGVVFTHERGCESCTHEKKNSNKFASPGFDLQSYSV